MEDAVENEASAVLREVWAGDGVSRAEIEASFGEGKTCRNMKHVNFDSLAEPGSDLGAAWREKLRREGKLGSSSLGELILGGDNVAASVPVSRS